MSQPSYLPPKSHLSSQTSSRRLCVPIFRVVYLSNIWFEWFLFKAIKSGFKTNSERRRFRGSLIWRTSRIGAWPLALSNQRNITRALLKMMSFFFVFFAWILQITNNGDIKWRCVNLSLHVGTCERQKARRETGKKVKLYLIQINKLIADLCIRLKFPSNSCCIFV